MSKVFWLLGAALRSLGDRWLRICAGAALLACSSVIAYGSLEPALSPPGDLSLDKVVHLTAYGVLGMLAAAALPRPAPMALAVLGLSAFACGIEVVQSLIPGRQGSLADLLAGVIGVIAGVVLGRWILKRVEDSASDDTASFHRRDPDHGRIRKLERRGGSP